MAIKFLFILIALLFTYQLIRNKGVKKLQWFLAAILFFPHLIGLVDLPGLKLNFQEYIVLATIVIFIFQERNKVKALRHFPLFGILLIVFMLLLAVGVFDTRLSLFLGIYRGMRYFLTNFFIVFIGFYYLNSISDFKRILRTLAFYFFILSIYGFFNFIFKANPYIDLIQTTYGTGMDVIAQYMGNLMDRFRISSFTWHPIYYGLFLGEEIIILMFMLTSGWFKGRMRPFSLICLFVVIANLILTNSRTPIIALAVGFIVYFIYSMKLKQKISVIIVGICLAIVALLVFPSASDIVGEAYNAITTQDTQVQGSSLEMREDQLGASVLVFYESPITGNGYNYIQEGLGFTSDRSNRQSDNVLQGFESYIFKLLIEQGLCGIVANILFFTSLVVFFIKGYRKNSKIGKQLSIAAISIVFLFLLFIIGTGDMSSFIYIITILGICMKAVLEFKKKHLFYVRRIMDTKKTQLNNKIINNE